MQIRKNLAEWGSVYDRLGDCKFNENDKNLSISIPPSRLPHDISVELSSCSAPIVVRPISGDFTIQVKISGDFTPQGNSNQQGRNCYVGAGIIIFADSKNYVRIEKAAKIDGSIVHYVNFEIRENGKLEEFGAVNDFPAIGNMPVWLKIEKKARKINGALSLDGRNWIYGKPKSLKASAWAKDDVYAGVASVSTSPAIFVSNFEDFIALRK